MNEYSHTIDSKGRMILPAKFREELGERFILTKGMDTCLMIYPRARWEKLIDALNHLPSTNPKVRALRRGLIGGSTECECDRQGRILIPSWLRAYGALEKDAKIVGVGDTIEIWSPAVLAKLEENEPSLSEIAESLDLPMNFDL